MSLPGRPSAPGTVTLALTDEDACAVLVNSLREAADEAEKRARRAREAENPSEDWADGQECVAQIACALVESIETQLDGSPGAATPRRN